MHRTYEMYVRYEDRTERFQAVTCQAHEALSEARRLLAEDRVAEIEVREAGEVVLTLAK